MTPKEKAKELVKRYALLSWKGKEFNLEYYKQCALIAVDELIKEYCTLPHFGELYQENIEYWEKVKQEIELL